MTHPDAAWSPYYQSPSGHAAPCACPSKGQRMRVGPTSRRRPFSILVNSCGWCARILRSIHDLSWREYDWVRRWNARIAREKQR